MRRFAYWLFPIIAIAVAVFIVALMIEINPAAPAIEQDMTLGKMSKAIVSDESSSGWIKHFNINNEKEYFYPVNEVTIALEDKESQKTQRYRLVVPLKDSYEFFCLKQELKNSNLPYLLNQEGEAMTALIDSADQSKLATLVAKLKTYQISATLSSFKED